MAETIRLVRIFLASPGDLKEERRLVKETERELNNCLADYLGFRVELKGWEDTLSGANRPQEIINQELDLCDLFIGMLYKRWGSPPTLDGQYTSGFEEEFVRSQERNKKTGRPEMAMYFKEISQEYLTDPGEQLRDVLEFKEKLTAGKTIFYELFDNPHDLQRRVREKIQSYLISIKSADREEEEGEKARTKSSNEESGKEDTIKSPFSVEGYEFLKGFIERTVEKDSLKNVSAFEIARFRLLSSAISKSGNDEPNLGVHDANIIFANKEREFGLREVSRLVDCGLTNLKHENAPIWHWFALHRKTAGDDILAFNTLSTRSIGEGAFDAMRLVSPTFANDDGPFDRDFFLNSWLSPDRSSARRSAALRYLKTHGIETDITFIRAEYDRADSSTSRIALEALISIQLRQNQAEALRTAYTNQFDSFDDSLLDQVLAIPNNLEEDTLRKGLAHRSGQIRLQALKELVGRGYLRDGEDAKFEKDPSAPVRFEIICERRRQNENIRDDDVRKVLVRPKRTEGRGLLTAFSATDQNGQDFYDRYLFEKYCSMREAELSEIVDAATIYDDIPYFALCTRGKPNNSGPLTLLGFSVVD